MRCCFAGRQEGPGKGLFSHLPHAPTTSASALPSLPLATKFLVAWLGRRRVRNAVVRNDSGTCNPERARGQGMSDPSAASPEPPADAVPGAAGNEPLRGMKLRVLVIDCWNVTDIRSIAGDLAADGERQRTARIRIRLDFARLALY